ncbi:MAG: S8 family peptidase [Firmicutes bacterium]|nr:S8 family peptidase [Bacillota bacterium]
MFKIQKTAFVFFTSLLLLAVSAAGGNSPVAAKPSPERCIVYTESPGASEQVKAEVGKKGGAVLKPLASKRQSGLVVQIEEGGKTSIKALPGVRAVEPDVGVSAVPAKALRDLSGKTRSGEELPWGIRLIGAAGVWDRDGNLAVDPGANAGQGVKVAIVDSGIEKKHEDLEDNLAGGINFAVGSPDNSNPQWKDFLGHGTLVAGICSAVDNNTGVIGAAPRASLYSVRVLDKSGSGYLSDLIEGIYWCADNGMNIANLSLGIDKEILEQNPYGLSALEEAVDYACANGVLLVAAAGNLRPDQEPSNPPEDNVDYPARFKSVLAVAAINPDGTWWPYSKTGPAVAIAAPGVEILSTFLKDGYLAEWGTSLAAPHVTAAAALLYASGRVQDTNNKCGIADEVREILCATAAGGSENDPRLGHGVVNALEAVKAVLNR